VLLLQGPDDLCARRRICLRQGLACSWGLDGRDLCGQQQAYGRLTTADLMRVKQQLILSEIIGTALEYNHAIAKQASPTGRSEILEKKGRVWQCQWQLRIGDSVPAKGDLQLWSNMRSTRGYPSCLRAAGSGNPCCSCPGFDTAWQQLLLIAGWCEVRPGWGIWRRLSGLGKTILLL
jgi:hypothetical protein